MASPTPSDGTTEDSRPQVAATPDDRIAVLLIGTRDSACRALRDMLAPRHWEIHEAAALTEVVGILNRSRIGAAICDTEIEHTNWQTLLATLHGRANPPNLVVSSRLADERLWAEVLNLGGYDVLAQPFERSEVLRVTQMAWMDWREKCQVQTAQTQTILRAQAAF